MEFLISEDYVSHWGVKEALRELLQNTLDLKGTFETNERKWEFTTEGVFEKKNWLIGNSTKRNDSKTIGQFGEGLKLAFLVLVRLGHSVVMTSGDTEYHPRLKKSKKFDSNLLEIKELKSVNAFKEKTILTVTSNSYAFPNLSVIYTDQKGILLAPKESGKVYYKGLFVTKMSSIYYGYNFDEGISLTRDRDVPNEYSVYLCASQLWAKFACDDVTMFKAIDVMSSDKYRDFYYIDSYAKRGMGSPFYENAMRLVPYKARGSSSSSWSLSFWELDLEPDLTSYEEWVNHAKSHLATKRKLEHAPLLITFINDILQQAMERVSSYYESNNIHESESYTRPQLTYTNPEDGELAEDRNRLGVLRFQHFSDDQYDQSQLDLFNECAPSVEDGSIQEHIDGDHCTETNLY